MESAQEPKRTQDVPVIISGGLSGDAITADRPLPEVAGLVSQGKIVILKSVFDLETMLAFRAAMQQWARDTPVFPHGKSASALTDANFHRIDDGTWGSLTPHVFHQFGFSRFDLLPDSLRRQVSLIAPALTKLQNGIAGTQFDISATGLRLKVLHYPSGGGFLTEHVHPYEPQRVGLIASISQIDKDFTSGGTSFLTPYGRVDSRDYHDIGDVLLFRYDLPHAVTCVDTDRQLDWNAAAGKWSVVLELRETYANSSITASSA